MFAYSNNIRRLNVLVVGCGSIGRWHIKGLEQSKYPLDVYACDVSSDALEELDKFIENKLIQNSKINFHKFNLFDLKSNDLPEMDLTILSTTARRRADVCAEIKSQVSSRAWLIEKPLEQSASRLKRLCDVFCHDNVFVNHPRRLVHFYQNISNDSRLEKLANVEVFGRNIGLACNVSHFLDLLHMITNQTPAQVDLSGLNTDWHRSTREGYWDVSGVLIVKYEGGIKLRLHCSNGLGDPIISLNSRVGRLCTIDEKLKLVSFSDGTCETVNLEPQSKITGRLLDELFEKGTSKLPSLNESAQYNQLVLEAMQRHWSRSQFSAETAIPFT